MAAFLELLSWNECLLLRYSTVCSSVLRAIGFSLVGYDGGGVGEPSFLEFVLFLWRRCSSCDKWLRVHVKSLICSCKGSVTPMTLDLRAFSVAPFIPFKRSSGILDAAQIPLKRTKMKVVKIIKNKKLKETIALMMKTKNLLMNYKAKTVN